MRCLSTKTEEVSHPETLRLRTGKRSGRELASEGEGRKYLLGVMGGHRQISNFRIQKIFSWARFAKGEKDSLKIRFHFTLLDRQPN